MKRWPILLLLALAAGVGAQGTPNPGYNKNYEEPEPWQEQKDVAPPAFPKQENLIEFYVSAVATNKYLIDASTLAVGTDGVVRYVLVVRMSGGATNVSFEGIDCRELNWKHYASGRGDGTWASSRAARSEWRRIENKPVNRHHAALSHDFFCPMGMAIRNADEGRNALRLGKHPNVN